MKVAAITGCKDCPYKTLDVGSWKFFCGRYKFSICSALEEKLPDTPHPDCKLSDLPTVDDSLNHVQTLIPDTSLSKEIKAGVEFVANFFIKEITK